MAVLAAQQEVAVMKTFVFQLFSSKGSPCLMLQPAFPFSTACKVSIWNCFMDQLLGALTWKKKKKGKKAVF